MCWGERLREDGEKGKCLLGLSARSVTNLPMQYIASVVQDQKPVVGRGWWGSHMPGVSLDCQQRRRKNALAGCGGNQGCSLTAVTSCFDPHIWKGPANALLLHRASKHAEAVGKNFHFWCHDNGQMEENLCSFSAKGQLLCSNWNLQSSLKWVKCLFPQKQGV